MTPAGLQHEDNQPVDLGLAASGMTPAGLHHGGKFTEILFRLLYLPDLLFF